MGQEANLEQLCEKLGASFGGDRKFGAEDPTQVSLESLWLQYGEQYGCRGSRTT